ncbi:cytochrome ubiquinol oxidase subunit I [Bauldia sp.]|uniref:cytochrome ubiquinol oxidase subunit I n=1 Tax=Bauldia sp. TaxID=2575872 RepID=UPI003BAB6073
MELDAVMLARIQFAWTVAFHIIFPSFTIGLSAWIATLLVIWRRTGEDHFRDLAKFWTKIFAVSFGMGVVSGIVLSYEFGTNWSHFSHVVGNVVGPLIGYEVLTAFFLEATFLGILLFGWNRVPPALHVTAAILVAVGTLFSAFWILSANSWMQYPTGHAIENGIAVPENWLEIVFSPTFHFRFLHMVTAAYITTAFVVIATGARYLLAGEHVAHARTMVRMGLGLAIVLVPLQIILGDESGRDVWRYQPAKLAAIEAKWEAGDHGPVPLVLFAIPSDEEERNLYEVAIPGLASIIVTRSVDGSFPGLQDFAVEDRPPTLLPFFGFRLMVGIGLIMLVLAFWGGFLLWRGRLEGARFYLRLVSWSWPLGFIAVIAGWIVAEVGRQPWVATGILRTKDAASPVSAAQVATSLTLFVIVYVIIFTAGLIYMNRLIRKGPAPAEVTLEGLPSRPLTGATGAGPASGG